MHEAFLVETEARRPRDQGVKTEATYHIHIILRTDVVLKRSGGSLELRLNRSGIFKHNFIYIMLKRLHTRLRRLLPRPRPRSRPSVSRPRPRPRHADSRPRRSKFQPRRDRAKALLRLETALRPRYQDRVHIPAICCIQVQNTTSGPKITRDDSSARCPSVVAVSNIRTAGSRRH